MASKAANPLLNPNATLQGSALQQAAHALANAQINPQVQALNQQTSQANKQTAGAVNQVGGYYNSLGNFANQGVQQAQGTNNGLNQTLAGLSQSQAAQQGQIGADAQSALSKYTPGGVGSSGYGALASELARQQGLSAQNMGNLQAYGATQGANGLNLASSNLGVNSLRGTEALKSIAQAGQEKVAPIKDKIAQLIAQKGSLYTTDLGQLRQQEIANQVTAAGLGIKQTDAATAAKNADTSATNAVTTRQNDLANQTLKAQGLTITQQKNLTDAGLSQQRIQATLRGQDLAHLDRQAANAIRAAAQNLTNNGHKPLTTTQNDKTLGLLSKITNAITGLQQGGLTAGAGGITYKGKAYTQGQVYEPHPTEAQIRSALASVDPLGGLLVQAGYELDGWGHLTPQTAANLHQAGLRGGTFRNAPIKVAALPAPATVLPKTGGPPPGFGGAGPLTGPAVG